MLIEQSCWTPLQGWTDVRAQPGIEPQLVLAFGPTDTVAGTALLETLRERYRDAVLLIGSTSGEISGDRVLDEAVVTTAVQFERTRVRGVQEPLPDAADSFDVGRRIAASLVTDDLAHVFVLSEGLEVHGTELIRGLSAGLPAGVGLSGGLACDGHRFERTVVGLDSLPEPGRVAAIGLYGDALTAHAAAVGGWRTFGPDRLITRSEGNVLYEVDGEPVLNLYKRYLGPHAKDLPGSGLLFPLGIRSAANPNVAVVRSVLDVDEATGSITFAGDVPQGAYARMMMTSHERRIEGAVHAAEAAQDGVEPQLALLVSCVGRKWVLGERVDEEVEAVREVLGESTVVTGFYSYAEIAPTQPAAICELHNQTMTVTVLSER